MPLVESTPVFSKLDGDPAAAWRAHSSAVLALISQDAVVATPYDGHFGPTTVGDTLERVLHSKARLQVIELCGLACAAGNFAEVRSPKKAWAAAVGILLPLTIGAAVAAQPGAGPSRSPEAAQSSPGSAPQSPFGPAPPSESPAPGPPEEQRRMAEQFVAQDPNHRALCEKPDGTVTVIVSRRVNPTGPMPPPPAAGCRGPR